MPAERLVKRIVHSSLESLQPTSVVATTIAKRAKETESSFLSKFTSAPSAGSGISPLVAISSVGGLLCLWFIVVCIGIACKYVNKPKSAAHSGSYSQSSSRLFRPSAAGYAARGSSPADGPPSNRQSAANARLGQDKVGLLSSAQPMGRINGSGVDPDESGASDASLGRGPGDARYPPPIPKDRQPNQHHRSTSSQVSITLTGNNMTPRKASLHANPRAPAPAGPSNQPYDAPNARYSPAPMGFSDTPMAGNSAPEFGFRPGQVFNYSAAGGAPVRTGPRPGQAPAVTRSGSRVFHGPPPARQAGSRKSLYQTTPRIESIGQGLNRSSRMYAEDENAIPESPSGPTNFSRRSRANLYGNASNYPSTGAMGMPMKRDVSNRSTIYGGDAAETQALSRAMEEGFGAGQSKRPMGPRGGGMPGAPLEQSRAALEGRSPMAGPYGDMRGSDPLGGMRPGNGASPSGLGFGPGAGPGPLGNRPRPGGQGQGQGQYQPGLYAQRQPVQYPAASNVGGPRRPMGPGAAGPGQGMPMGMRQQYGQGQPIVTGGGRQLL